MLPRLGGLSNTRNCTLVLDPPCCLLPPSSSPAPGEKLYVLVALGQFVVDHAVGMRSNSVGNRFAVYFHGASPAVLVDPDPPQPVLADFHLRSVNLVSLP